MRGKHIMTMTFFKTALGMVCLGMRLLPAMSFPAAAAEPVAVGAIFSQTGIAAMHNAPLLEMTRLAVEELNQNGGLLGRPADLILLDNKSTPIGARLAAEEAIRRGVAAVIGAHWSSHSLAMGPALQAAGIPMISPGSTNPAVTLIGDYVFRVCFLDSFQGRAMSRFARDDLNAGTAAVLKNVDEEYSIKLAEYFADAFTQIGGKVLLDAGYRGKAVDFADILGRVLKNPPDVVYVPGYTRDSGLLIKQARSMGVAAIFLGGDAWDEIHKYGGDAADGSYHSAPWHPDVPFDKSVHLKEVYRKTRGADIASMSAPLAYDAVMVLADAVRRAGGTDGAALRQAIADTRGFPGATGLISFDANGDPEGKEVIIIRLENGIPMYHKAITP